MEQHQIKSLKLGQELFAVQRKKISKVKVTSIHELRVGITENLHTETEWCTINCDELGGCITKLFLSLEDFEESIKKNTEILKERLRK